MAVSSTSRSESPQVVFLFGPTAVGKTAIAIELAQRYPVDVISVDAAQVYRTMDIGTAKPPVNVLKHVPHALIDICEPSERYSAGRFRIDALNEIRRSVQLGRIPLLVGGTMFYFQALEKGLSDLPAASETVGEILRRRGKTEGWPKLHAELKEIDPVAAERISSNDSQRIQRLHELFILQGRQPSELMKENLGRPLPFEIVKIAVVDRNRLNLRGRIEARFHEMLKRGLLDEAERIFRSPSFDMSLPAMRLVGYKQAWQYFLGHDSYDSMVEKAIRGTCAIAKRQMTWIRNLSGVVWVDGGSPNSLRRISVYLERIVSDFR